MQRRELILGIDFGTSYTSAAAIINGKVECVLEHGDPTIPSVVYVPPRGPMLIGRPAHMRRAVEPAATITSIKRLLGRKFTDRQVRTMDYGVPYKITAGPNQLAILEIRGNQYTCEQLVAQILIHVRDLASRRFGARIHKIVVGVPAMASADYVNALRRAARLAHLRLVQVVPEPIAAALAHGLHNDPADRNLAILDFGGGTFDVSMVEQRGRVFRPLHSAGDDLLGGDDFDAEFAAAVAASVHRTSKYVMQTDAVRWQMLMFRCEAAKRLLSSQLEARLKMSDAYVYDGNRADIDVRIERHWLAQHWRRLLRRSQEAVVETMAELDQEFEVSDAVLVGGTTLIPAVREVLGACFPEATIHRASWANLAVTTGLALQTWEHAMTSTAAPAVAVSPAVKNDISFRAPGSDST